jgi:hypothetical protein
MMQWRTGAISAIRMDHLPAIGKLEDWWMTWQTWHDG